MMDVNYFIEEASCFNQNDFEHNFADVIHVFDTNETHLITEDGKELIIYWYSDGHYQGYQVIEKPTSITAQMKQSHTTLNKVDDVIETLRSIEVDGETMQYILKKVGMEEQMLRQLVMSADMDDVFCLVEEREEFEGELDN